MVVVPEPAVKGSRTFGAGAVDGAVRPAVGEGADEALGFAVGLRPVGAGAVVADAELAAGERVDLGHVAGAVVGEDRLDGYAVAGKEHARSVQEGGRGCGFLIVEDLGVGESAVVVDGDVDVLPADGAAKPTAVIAAAPVEVLAAEHMFASAALDPAELLDVDVYELARPRALVTHRLLEPEPAKPAKSEPGQDPRHRRERHPQRLGDLSGGKAQSTKLDDRFDPIGGRSISDPSGSRRAIAKAPLTFAAIPADPLARTANADPRRPRPPPSACIPQQQPARPACADRSN